MSSHYGIYGYIFLRKSNITKIMRTVIKICCLIVGFLVWYAFVFVRWYIFDMDDVNLKHANLSVFVISCPHTTIRYANAKKLVKEANLHGFDARIVNCLNNVAKSELEVLKRANPTTGTLILEDDIEVQDWRFFLLAYNLAMELHPQIDILSFYMSKKYNTWKVIYLTSYFWDGPYLHRVLPWSGYAITSAIIVSPKGRDEILRRTDELLATPYPIDIWYGILNKQFSLIIYRYTIPGKSLIKHKGEYFGGSVVNSGRKIDLSLDD